MIQSVERENKVARPTWAIGVDLGGTKVEVAAVDREGYLHQRLRRATDVKDGPAAVEAEIVTAVRELLQGADEPPAGIGIGVAGQIERMNGAVRFAPNLDWHNVPLQADLGQILDLPVVVTNDVRAATWGEWLYGSGRGFNDLVCLFIGTGIGGSIVSGGRMLSGSSNTAGEVGHMTIDLHGPTCHCGNQGCLEALAGGWAIARRAQEAVAAEPAAGAALLTQANGRLEAITARTVVQAAHSGDPLARELVEEVTLALIAGAVSLVNAFNPARLILGGGIVEGLPELVGWIKEGVFQRGLAAATTPLQVVPAQLHNEAGVVGAAALALHSQTMKIHNRDKE